MAGYAGAALARYAALIRGLVMCKGASTGGADLFVADDAGATGELVTTGVCTGTGIVRAIGLTTFGLGGCGFGGVGLGSSFGGGVKGGGGAGAGVITGAGSGCTSTIRITLTSGGGDGIATAPLKDNQYTAPI